MDLAAFDTLHRGRKSIEEISTITGINKSSLYRYALPIAQNGLDIPMRKLSPIMQTAGRYDLLHRLTALNGFLCVRPPRVPSTRSDENTLIANLQSVAADATVKTLQFFEKPTVTAMRSAENALTDTAGAALSIRKMLQRRGQLEFRF